MNQLVASECDESIVDKLHDKCVAQGCTGAECVGSQCNGPVVQHLADVFVACAKAAGTNASAICVCFGPYINGINSTCLLLCLLLLLLLVESARRSRHQHRRRLPAQHG